MGIMFIFIAVILIGMLVLTERLDARKFIGEVEPYFSFLKEDDYKFLLELRYGEGTDEDVRKLFNKRIRDAVLITFILFAVLLFTKVNFIGFIVVFIIGFLVFKSPYFKLQGYYKRNLSQINQMLPYYLKSLEILIQHYTVPVALAKSVETAPDIFKRGLTEMIRKIEDGDSSIDPYMDFAKEYPVRDSMRMMRLLYRLSLGSQENKNEQLIMFAKNVSNIQNKMREQKYQARLDAMEKMTMVMLFCTGGGILAILMFSVVSMIGI